MHKKQAASLFRLLSDEDQLKILKKIKTNNHLNYLEVKEIMGIDDNKLNICLNNLIDGRLITKKDNDYYPNKELIDNLMSFVSTPCSCDRKFSFSIIAYGKKFVFKGEKDAAWYNFDHSISQVDDCKLRIDANREVYAFFIKDGKEIQGVVKDDEENILPDNFPIENGYCYHFVECEKQGYFV